jgi:hypothetical protein
MTAAVPVVALALLAAHGVGVAQTFEQKMEAQVERLVAKHGSGTDKELRKRLVRMAKEDQAVRVPAKISVISEAKQEATDDRLTEELKQIVAAKGWPTIALVGLLASQKAALVLIHSRDHEFQRAMLPKLQELADNGEILGSGDIATIVDKILVSEGKPQRFGTQFKWANGTGEMLPVEDIQHLDERREKYMLPPIAEYKKLLADMYKLKIE